MDTITVCMGSSCFGKGNAIHADFASRFIAERHLEGRVTIKGCLCCNACAQGPNIKINDKIFSALSEEAAGQILVRELGLQS